MSYTRQYSDYIDVTGSVRASYPPSEHGGTHTVTYEARVPVNFNIIVATEPFDASVSNAALCVDGLTASVTAMNAANCAAIAQCSEQISDSIINGFFNLVQSDISTKKSEAKTQIQAKAALLFSQSEAVEDTHNRMLRDVERERAKYGKVFKGLDNELERRINELDRPAFKISQKAREEVVVKPYLSLAASSAEELGAKSIVGGKIAAAGLRQKVSAVLQSLSDFLHNNLKYRHTMHDILWNKSVEETEQQILIPVAYCVSEDISGANVSCKCFAPSIVQNDGIPASVSSYINEHSNEAAREIPDDEMRLIQQAFSAMVQDNYTGLENHDEYRDRVYTEILRLWKNGCSSLKQV